MFERRRAATTAPVVLGRGAWGLAGGLFLEVVACSIALVGLIQGTGWWWALVGTAALLLAIPAALRSVGVAAWVATLLDLLAFGVFVQLVFEPRTSVLGVIPTHDSVAGLRGLFTSALLAIQDQGIPADPLPELIFFVVLFGGAFVVVLDVLAVTLRIPATTAVAMGAVLVVPAVLQPDGLTLTGLGAGAAAWFVVLKADGRIRFGTRGGNAVALAIGASVTLLAVVVAGTAPGFTEYGRTPTSGPVSIGSSVDPLIDLGKDLREPVPVDVLRYTTASQTPTYLQLTTLDRFTGTTWSHTPASISSLQGGTQLQKVPGLDSGSHVGAARVTTKIDVENLHSAWIPAPYPATKVSGRNARSYQKDDLTIYSQTGDLSGQKYTATSLDLEPTQQQLQASSEIGDSVEATGDVSQDLYLPADIPPIITETADQIAASADGTSEFDLALAIQQYFQSSINGFAYSTDTPDSIDGSSLDVVARFLQVKEGYCVHFATAMAVLARVYGIPSRIAIGYLPGTPISAKGNQITYQVDSSDLHAWPQLYFPNIGWLDFEPTVSRGSAPSYTVATTPESVPTSAPLASEAPLAASKSTPSAHSLPAQQTASSQNAVAARNGVPVELSLLVILALLAAPAVARRLRRRGRIARLREEGLPPTLAWDEVRDTARDLGFAASATETPREFAARLRSDWHPDAAHQRDLDDILEQLELTAYGPPRHWERYFELADKTVSVTSAMRASRPWRVRLFAVLVPLSLFSGLSDRRRASANGLS